jgi:hypothetical protein
VWHLRAVIVISPAERRLSPDMSLCQTPKEKGCGIVHRR